MSQGTGRGLPFGDRAGLPASPRPGLPAAAFWLRVCGDQLGAQAEPEPSGTGPLPGSQTGTCGF